MNFTLEAVALHNLIVTERRIEQIGAVDPTTMPARAAGRLGAYLTNVADRSTSDDRAAAAFFSDGAPPTELVNLQTCPIAEFERNSVSAMDLLLTSARGNARDGLVVFVRGRGDNAAYFACFKLQLGRFEGVRWVPGRPPQQALEDVEVANLLPEPKELQKAAMVPSPDGLSDLRVVDDQLTRTADYWQRFLGASATPGDRERMRRMVGAVNGALRELGAPDREEALGRAVRAAATRPTDTTPNAFLSQVAADTGVAVAALRTAVGTRSVDLSPSATLTPVAARQTRTIWDLGGEVELRGPRGAVEERTAVVREGAATYVKVRVEDGPSKRYTS